MESLGQLWSDTLNIYTFSHYVLWLHIKNSCIYIFFLVAFSFALYITENDSSLINDPFDYFIVMIVLLSSLSSVLSFFAFDYFDCYVYLIVFFATSPLLSKLSLSPYIYLKFPFISLFLTCACWYINLLYIYIYIYIYIHKHSSLCFLSRTLYL